MKQCSVLVVLFLLSFLTACNASGSDLQGILAFSSVSLAPSRGIYLWEPATTKWFQFTSEKMFLNYPTWSPDADRLAFLCHTRDEERICLIDLEENITTLCEAWDWDEERQVSVCSIDEKENITALFVGDKIELGSFSNTPIVWSRDGTTLIFSGHLDEDYDEVGLYEVDVATGGIQLLTSFEASQYYRLNSLSLSPDGDTMALDAVYYEIHLLDMETLEMRYLTKGEGPMWSPSGEQIAFINNRKIYAITLDNGVQELLYSPVAGEVCPVSVRGLAWSPDGRYLMFLDCCHELDPMDLYALDIETGQVQRLPSPQGSPLEYPAWAGTP
jgi:Tol biopolymer transport system component